MARPRKAEENLSIQEMFGEVSNSLIKQATEPDIRQYKPHDKQELFHKSKATGKLFIGGNRSGKLWGVSLRIFGGLLNDTPTAG